MSEFEALCANDGELAKLRTSIRDFLATDRAAFGWEPAVDSWLAKWVARLVMVTKTHKATIDDINGAVLSDADLSVLGSDVTRYREYARAVREEYASVSDEVFKPARAQVLTSLLAGSIFHTGPGRDRWEERARRNVADEIQALTG